MKSIFDLVASELTVFSDSRAFPWIVTPSGDHACTAESGGVVLEISEDPHYREVISSICFSNQSDTTRDRLYTRVIARLFPDMDTARHNTGLLEVAVKREVRLVHKLLERISGENISPAAIYYFHRGYSQAYTDYMNGAFDEGNSQG